LPDFLETLSSAIVEATDAEPKEYLRGVTRDVCDITRTRWNDSERALTAEGLEAYDQATVLLSPLPPIPNLSVSWANATKNFSNEIKWSKESKYFMSDEVRSLIRLAKAISTIEPRFLRQNEFPQRYRTQFEDVLRLAREEADAGVSDDDAEELRFDFYRISALRDLVKEVYEILPELKEHDEDLLPKLNRKAEETDDREPSEPEQEYDLPSEGTAADVDSVFFDL